MNYLPTQDKLHSLGFDAGQVLSNGNQNYYGPHGQRIIVRHQQGKVRFRDESLNVLLALPSEEYFDLTLVALGWK